jgi:hypothetical protein
VVHDTQVFFCFLDVAFFVFVYRPMLRRLDAEIKGTRELLTLLPNDVITGCREIKEGITALIRKLRSQ